jgi:hypothetical protein
MMEMEFDIPSLTYYKTYCPTCSRTKDAGLIEPQNCKVCGDLLIFIDLENLPKKFEPKLTKKGLLAMIIIFIPFLSFLTLALLILAYSTITTISLILCIIGAVSGVAPGCYLAFKMANEQYNKLIKTYFPTDSSMIPKIKGVRFFQLGRYLSGDIIVCPKCKMFITSDSKFCKECGTQL